MVRQNVLRRAAWASMAAALLAAPVIAQSTSCSISLKCSGVDRNGCLDFSLGSKCSTKCFKDIKTGICSYVAKCNVWNKCERECSFVNQGCPIIDCQTKKWLTCTRDCQIVSKCTKWNRKLKCWDRVSCSLSGCYNPCSGGDSYNGESGN